MTTNPVEEENWPFMLQKRPYREPDSWYWLVVDRRNGMSTMRRFSTRSAAQTVADQLNDAVSNRLGNLLRGNSEPST